jgi:hypothetical protein
MKITLTQETIHRIREALGSDVDLGPEVVPSVLARLAVEAPAVYSKVLEELSGSQIRLDSEDELRRRQRRGMLRRLLFSWGEYESGVGDRLLEKRHIAAAVPLALAVLTIALLAFSLVLGHRAAPARTAVVEKPFRAIVRPETRSPSIVVRQPDPTTGDAMIAAPRRSPVSPPGRSASAGMLPVPALPPGLWGLPDAPGLTGRGLGSPVVVSLQANAREAGSGGERGTGGLSPIVYNRLADADSTPHEAVGHLTDPTLPKISGSALGPRIPGGLVPSLVPGTRLPATLLTGVVVVPGGTPVPVAVETGDPHGIWVGQAVLGPGDRVQVTVALPVQQRADGVRGIALDPERLLPGLPGRTTIRHSSAVAAMATAALQAASDYAQAAARQVSIGMYGGLGSIVVGGQQPEAWTFLAARLAQDFQARGAPGGWVSTTEIPAGTQLIILITGAS